MALEVMWPRHGQQNFADLQPILEVGGWRRIVSAEGNAFWVHKGSRVTTNETRLRFFCQFSSPMHSFPFRRRRPKLAHGSHGSNGRRCTRNWRSAFSGQSGTPRRSGSRWTGRSRGLRSDSIALKLINYEHLCLVF